MLRQLRRLLQMVLQVVLTLEFQLTCGIAAA
jgi:hypothetical protein